MMAVCSQRATCRLSSQRGLLARPPGYGLRRRLTAKAIHIDRREHLENAWRRGEEQEKWRSTIQVKPGDVIDVKDLSQLESVLEKAGSSLVVLYFYSRSCGVCKEAQKYLEKMSREALQQQARVVFLRHDIITEFDDFSDITRLYKVKAVPQFMFIDDGAVVRRLSMRDIRRMNGPAPLVQAAVAEDLRKLRHTLLEVLLTRAPSARA